MSFYEIQNNPIMKSRYTEGTGRLDNSTLASSIIQTAKDLGLLNNNSIKIYSEFVNNDVAVSFEDISIKYNSSLDKWQWTSSKQYNYIAGLSYDTDNTNQSITQTPFPTILDTFETIPYANNFSNGIQLTVSVTNPEKKTWRITCNRNTNLSPQNYISIELLYPLQN